MSRTLRLALLPPLITLAIGLVLAASVAIGDSSDEKHRDFGSRFRLWGGLALMVSCLPVVFSASSTIALSRSLSAFPVGRYRAVVAGVVASAWAGSALALYSLLYIKPIWLAVLAAVNVLVVGGIVYGVVVSRSHGGRT